MEEKDYEVKKSNDDILSILIKYYKYNGGAHGIYEYVPYNPRTELYNELDKM